MDILKNTHHPNIIKFKEAYQDMKYYHIVTEYCSGGDLFDMIIKKQKFREDDAHCIKLIRGLLGALRHLHDKEIAHRDIKPENLMFENDEGDAEIKLIDFGLSKHISADKKLCTRVGTPYYVATEVLSGYYGIECDMWSIGILTYLLLAGYPPFFDEKDHLIFRKIRSAEVIFPEEDWSDISESAKDFIGRLIQKNPKNRMTVIEALDHPWVANNEKKGVLCKNVLSKLKKF